MRTRGEAPNDVRTREQLVAALSHEAADLIRSDIVFRDLKFLKKAIPLLCTFLGRERRRKKPSEQLKWVLAALRPDVPVSNAGLASILNILQLMRKQMDGAQLPPDTGEKSLRYLKNLMAIRKEPKYWREYRAYCDGKTVSEILRDSHPSYVQLRTWERDKYFRKVYNAIQRLIQKYGGPPLNIPPPQF
jgi:hypothetical protein